MKPSNLLSRQLPLGTVLVAALALGACGGGGGSSGTPAASPPAASPPVASLGCSNVQGSGNGYVMGVCVTSNGSTGGVFQNYTVGVDRSSTGIKAYTATLGGSPSGAGTVTSSISGEECAANGIGNAFVYTTVSLDTAGATTGPQWIVQSVNETFAPNTPLLCKQTGSSQLALRNPAYFPMTYLDGGMVERLATAAASPPVSTYLAGWVSSINSTGNAAPSANRSYTSGRTVARAVTQVAGAYGVDTAASATVTGSSITISLSNFSYRRDNADGTTAGIPAADHRLGSVTMTGTISGSTFSGTIVGSDVAGSAGAVTGTFEGRFGGPAGSEVAARYAIRFTGNSSVVAGAVFLK
jgi:hypothetical protein